MVACALNALEESNVTSKSLRLYTIRDRRCKMKTLTAIGAALVTLAAISADVVRGEKIEEAYMTVVVMGVILMLILAAHRELMTSTVYGALAGLIGLVLPPLAKPAEVAAIGFAVLLVVTIWAVDKTDKVDSVS